MTASRPPRIVVNVHGRIVPSEEATVSALDHGFLYGDSVYETVRTFRRRPFLLEPHLDRLERSMQRIFLPWPVPRDRLAAEVERSVAQAPFPGDLILRVVCSRGPGPLGLAIDLCRDPRYLIYVVELLPDAVPPEADPDGPDGGVAVVISSVHRYSPRALDPAIKSGNFLSNILAYREARTAGAHEALLRTAEGHVAEGTTSNVFIVRDGAVRTPRSDGILQGITRAVVLEELAAAGIPAEERDLLPEEVSGAEEAFISSSVRGVVPIATVDGRPVGRGVRGPVTHRIQRLYRDRLERECGGPS